MNDDDKLKNVRPAPAGWKLGKYPQTFAFHAGPMYFRERGDAVKGKPGVGFYSEPHHGNLGNVIHGGALMTLADMALFDICFREYGEFPAVTLSLNADFLNPGPIGKFIEAGGEITRAGKSIIFVRGMVEAEDTPILSFSGSIKRLSRA